MFEKILLIERRESVVCHICTSFYCCHKCFHPLDEGVYEYEYKHSPKPDKLEIGGYGEKYPFKMALKEKNNSSYQKVKNAYCSKCSKEMLLERFENETDSVWAGYDENKRIATVLHFLKFKVMDIHRVSQYVFGYQTGQATRFIKFADHLGRVWSGRGTWNKIRVRLLKQKAEPNDPL